MKKQKNIKDLLVPWNDKNIKINKGLETHKFLDRERVLNTNWKRLHSFAEEYLLSEKKLKILDVGSGNGATLEIFNHYGHDALGLDFTPDFEKNNWLYKPFIESQGLKCVNHNGSILPYPFKDKEFDFLISFGTINFFKPVKVWEDILNEFSRITKHGFVVGFNAGKDYDEGLSYIKKWKSNDFKLVLNSGSIYKWKAL